MDHDQTPFSLGKSVIMPICEAANLTDQHVSVYAFSAALAHLPLSFLKSLYEIQFSHN
jgi:hypothetical protein